MTFAPTDFVFEGFRITRQKPILLFWLGLVYLVTSVAGLFLMLPAFIELMEVLKVVQSGTEMQQAEVMKMMGVYARIASVTVPLSLLAMALVYPAVVRAVIEPTEQRFGYLRFGRDEVNTLVVILAAVAACFLMTFFAGLVVSLASAAGPAVGALVGLVLFLAVVVGYLWLAVRFSLSIAATVAEKRIAIKEGWAMTKGRFWPLLGIMVLTWILTIGVSLLVGMVSMPFSAISGGGYGIFMDMGITPVTVIGFSVITVLNAALAAAQALIVAAPFAAAYRALKT